MDAVTGRVGTFLDQLDLDNPNSSLVRIPLDFQGHGIALHASRRDEAIVLEKRGPGGCRVDLAARRIAFPLAPLPGHIFYGHAAWSADGRALFVVETEARSGLGAISVRDADNFAPLRRIATGGHAPHDCCLSPDGRALIVANGGGPAGSDRRASIAVIDLATDTLLQRHELDDPGRNAGHLAVDAKGALAVVSAPREGLSKQAAPGGIALGTIGTGLACVTTPREVASALIGEALSVAIHGASRTVAATHPEAGLVSLWTLDGGLRAILAVPQPRGVTVAGDGKHFVVSWSSEGRLLTIDPTSLQVRTLDAVGRGCFGGAHVYAVGGTKRH